MVKHLFRVATGAMLIEALPRFLVSDISPVEHLRRFCEYNRW